MRAAQEFRHPLRNPYDKPPCDISGPAGRRCPPGKMQSDRIQAAMLNKSMPNKSAPAAAPGPTPDVTAGPAEHETGCVLTVDLAAIVKNWKALAQRVVLAD